MGRYYTKHDNESLTFEMGELGLEMEVEYTVRREMQEDYEGDGSEPGGILLHRMDTVLSESLDTIDAVRILDHKHGNHWEVVDIPEHVQAALTTLIGERLDS